MYMDFPHWSTAYSRRHRDTFLRCTDNHDHSGESIANTDEKSTVELGESAILRLPPETMAEIFGFSQLISQNHYVEKSNDFNWCWLTLTHVCKYWRDVAINTQELWVYIDAAKHASTEQTTAYLKRSRVSSLYVYFDVQEPGVCAPECISLVLHHMHRIRELHLRNVRRLGYLAGLFNSPAPQLQSFTLEMDSRKLVNIKSLFAGQAPKLTSLSLHAFSQKWGSIPIFTNLRHLHISCAISLQDILSIVSHNRSYEQLSFSAARKIGSFDILQYQPHILMPYMSNLAMRDAGYLVLTELFKTVVFPTECSWSIHCIDFPANKEGVDPKCVVPRTSGSKSFPYLNMVISDTFVKMTAYSNNAGENWSQRQRSVTYSRHPIGQIHGESDTICGSFSLISSLIREDFWCSATELRFEVMSYFAEDLRNETIGRNVWLSVLKLLPDLRKLTVKHTRTLYPSQHVGTEIHHGLLNAVGNPPEDNQSSGDVLCTDLSELHLHEFDLRSNDILQLTLDSLQYRNKCGKGLSLLSIKEISNGSWSNSSLRLLRESGVARTVEFID